MKNKAVHRTPDLDPSVVEKILARRAPTRPNPHQSSIPTGQTHPTGNLDSEEDRYRQ